MYRCKECGCEYKEKPDFCDCGNDTFEEIDNPVSGVREYAKISTLDKAELLSRIIFGLCLILSLLVLMFFPKVDKKPADKTTQKPVNIVKTTNPNIPPLDSFWIDSKPVVPQPQPVEEPATPVQQIKEIFIKPKPQRVEQPKPVVKQQSKLKNNQQAKPVKPQQSKPQPTQRKVTAPRQAIKNTATKTNTYELLNYKNRLRNALLSNLRFSQVQGSGECGIEFSIDASGKLINRAFTFQSDNKSVNDEVYKMLMRTPRFAAPPSSYKGERIKMIFRLNNNNYSVEFSK